MKLVAILFIFMFSFTALSAKELKPINNVSFENWAAATAHITRGMSEEEAAKVLGVSLKDWEDASEKWSGKLAELMSEDINIANEYGNIFNNPNVGKFANSTKDVSIESVLKKVPTLDKHYEIFYHIDAYPKDDIEAMLKREYGLNNIAEWVQVSAHWFEHDKQRNGFYIKGKATEKQIEDTKKWSDHVHQITTHWKKIFAEKYKK